MDKAITHPETVRLINELGGTVKLASICDVSPAAVTQWKENGIPSPRFQFLQLKFPKANWTGVKVARRSAAQAST